MGRGEKVAKLLPQQWCWLDHNKRHSQGVWLTVRGPGHWAGAFRDALGTVEKILGWGL